MARRRSGGVVRSASVTDLSPQERHEKFVRENGEWNRRVEESLSRLRKLARRNSSASSNGA
jgi:hypothetical protein